MSPLEDLVLEHQVEGAAGEPLTAGQPSAGSFTALARNTRSIEFGPEQKRPSRVPHSAGRSTGQSQLRLIHDQFAVLDVIAERHVAAHPHALFLRGRDLVADALAGDLALELGE